MLSAELMTLPATLKSSPQLYRQQAAASSTQWRASHWASKPQGLRLALGWVQGFCT